MIARMASLLRMQIPAVKPRGLLFAHGTTVPSSADGYQVGCLFQHTDGSAGTALYVNEGSVTSSSFTVITATGTIADLNDVADAFATRLLETGTYQSTAGGGVVLSAANNRPFSLLYDDAGADLSGADVVRGMLSRILLTVDQTAHTNLAVRGQLKLLTGVDVATGIYAPVQGYIEVAGTSIASSGATLSCLSASLEVGTALTAASGGEIAGVHVETTGSGTLTATGTIAGILVDKASGAANWPVGLLVKDSVSPVVIGAAVADSAIDVGAFSPPSTNFLGLQMNFTNSGTSLGRLTGIQVSVGDTSTHSNTIACARFYSEKTSATGSHEHWGIMAQNTVTAGKVANTVAGMFITIVKNSAVVGTDTGDHRACAVAADIDLSGTGDYATTPDMITAAIIATQLGHTGASATGQKLTGLVCAQMGGDSKTITAGAYFKCLRKNSISASQADYGLDMYHDEAGAYLPVSFAVADIRFAASAYLVCYDTALSDNDATSAPKGSIATTTHSTGGGQALFVSDGSNWQAINIS